MNLELGGGVSPIKKRNVGMDDYVNIDVIESPSIDIVHDLTKIPWPIDSESVDNIYSSEFVEHVSYHQVGDILKESYRILKPGGRFAFECPDFEGICKNFLRTSLSQREVDYLRRGICGDQFSIYDFHRSIWWEGYARRILRTHGFVKVKRYPAPVEREDYKKLPFDQRFLKSVKLCIEAYKP